MLVVKVHGCCGTKSVGSQSGFGVLLWTGRKKRRGLWCFLSVEGGDLVAWCFSLVGAWSLEGRFSDEQPQPAAEGPQDAY